MKKRREPIEDMIDDFHFTVFLVDLDEPSEGPWEDVRNFAAYLSQVDEEMYPIGEP
jgi:hypothetical protein